MQHVVSSSGWEMPIWALAYIKSLTTKNANGGSWDASQTGYRLFGRSLQIG